MINTNNNTNNLQPTTNTPPVDKKEKRKAFTKKFVPIFIASLSGAGLIAGITLSTVQCSTYNEVYSNIGFKELNVNCNTLEVQENIVFSKQPDGDVANIKLIQTPEQKAYAELELLNPINEVANDSDFQVINKLCPFNLKLKKALTDEFEKEVPPAEFSLEVTFKHKNKVFNKIIDGCKVKYYIPRPIKPNSSLAVLIQQGSGTDYHFSTSENYVPCTLQYKYITNPINEATITATSEKLTDIEVEFVKLEKDGEWGINIKSAKSTVDLSTEKSFMVHFEYSPKTPTDPKFVPKWRTASFDLSFVAVKDSNK